MNKGTTFSSFGHRNEGVIVLLEENITVPILLPARSDNTRTVHSVAAVANIYKQCHVYFTYRISASLPLPPVTVKACMIDQHPTISYTR